MAAQHDDFVQDSGRHSTMAEQARPPREEVPESEEARRERLQEEGAGCGVCWPLDPDVLGIRKYDYRWLCLPQMPWKKGGVEAPMFLGKDEKVPLALALLMGLQHALAMVAAIATSGGLLIAGDACFPWQKDSKFCDSKSYLVSAAWITSGLLTVVQVFRAKICNTGYYLGTGLISVMGTSFTFLPIAREMVRNAILEAKSNDECGADGDCQEAAFRGYGNFLGTCMVACLFEVAVSFLPSRTLKKIFPPVVTATAVILIGGGLISSGVKYIGGGVFCAENMESRHAAFGTGPQLCNENGNVVLAFGSPEYIGLAFTVIIFSTLLQFFGSPFLKSTSLFWGLLFGMLVSGLSTYEAVEGDQTCHADGCAVGLVAAVPGQRYSYWNSDQINQAPVITFLWNNDPNPLAFLGFAPEYFIPILIGFCISTAETVGDIGLSAEASRVPVHGADHDSRVQGGLLADGVNSFIAALFTSPPNTTISQNNGVISLTRVASRAVGFACAFWLILFGVLGKVGAVFSSIPICVVGGLVFMCFSMVFVGGINILASMSAKGLSRRNAFILTLALGIGMGVAMEPHLFEAGGGNSFYSQNLNHNYGFWPAKTVCETFPSKTVFTPATCEIFGVKVEGINEANCTQINGLYTGETSVELISETCIGDNGNCCTKYSDGGKMWRTSLIMVLKTPYCIGVLVAGLLNLLLPVDREERALEEVKQEKKDPELTL